MSVSALACSTDVLFACTLNAAVSELEAVAAGACASRIHCFLTTKVHVYCYQQLASFVSAFSSSSESSHAKSQASRCVALQLTRARGKLPTWRIQSMQLPCGYRVQCTRSHPISILFSNLFSLPSRQTLLSYFELISLARLITYMHPGLDTMRRRYPKR